MKTLNRSAFIVRPREPYFQWAASLDEEASQIVKHHRQRVSIYLIPENSQGDAETPPLEDYFEAIFEHELDAWSRDDSRWPKIVGLRTVQRMVRSRWRVNDHRLR